MNENIFRVMVPCVWQGHTKFASFIMNDQQFYTREQAIDVLKTFFNHTPWDEGTHQECWAESDNERFTLHFPANLLEADHAQTSPS